MYLFAEIGPHPKRHDHNVIEFLLPDAKTPFGRTLIIKTDRMTIRVLEKLGADRAYVARELEDQGQGGVVIHPTDAQLAWIEPNAARRRVLVDNQVKWAPDPSLNPPDDGLW